jgi:hypothetical protein
MIEHGNFGVLRIEIFAVNINLHRFHPRQTTAWPRGKKAKSSPARQKGWKPFDGPWASGAVADTYSDRLRTKLDLQQPSSSDWIQTHAYDTNNRMNRITRKEVKL